MTNTDDYEKEFFLKREKKYIYPLLGNLDQD